MVLSLILGHDARESPSCDGVPALIALPVAATAAATLSAGDLGRRVAEGRTDLVDINLEHGALLALAGLVAARLQPARDDDAGALGQGLGHVLGVLAPHRTVEEHGVAVLPLVRLTIERAGGRRDGEVRDSGPVGREAELRIGGEIADDRDGGFACHVIVPSEIGLG